MKQPFKQLLEEATPGPWHVTDIYKDVASQRGPIARLDDCTPNDMEQRLANAAFIARCNPANMRLVLEALEDVSSKIHDCEAGRINWNEDFACRVDRALKLLNGETP